MRYLKLLLLLRNVSTVYEEEKGKGKPVYLSRRFVGMVLTLVSAILYLTYGVELADIESTAEAIVTLLTVLGTLYGAVMAIVGQIRRNREPQKAIGPDTSA